MQKRRRRRVLCFLLVERGRKRLSAKRISQSGKKGGEVFLLGFFPGKDILRRKKIHFSLLLRDLMKISKGAAVCQKARKMCDAKNASCTTQHAKVPD